jgi:hypothetical protein
VTSPARNLRKAVEENAHLYAFPGEPNSHQQPAQATLPPTDPCRQCIPGCPFPDGQSVLNLAAASAEDQSHEDTPLSIQPRYATALSRLPRLHKRCEASQVLKLDEARPPSPSLSQCAHHVNFEM